MADFIIPIEHITFSIFPNNTISITDNHNYVGQDYAVFEWFVNAKNDIVLENIHDSGPNTSWVTDKLSDGHLIYYKFVVPKHTDSLSGDFCWEKTDGEIKLKHRSSSSSQWEIISLSEAFKLIHDSSSVIDGNNECYWCPGAEMFLLGNIKKCLTKLQTEYIHNVMRGKCNDLVQDKRNFLHAAIEVIKYLLMNSDYDGAQNILDELSRPGCELCGDNYNHVIGCNCGGA